MVRRDPREELHARVAAERAAQGLPEYVEDAETLDAALALLLGQGDREVGDGGP